MPKLRRVRTFQHQVGGVCTAEAMCAVDAAIKGAACRSFVLHGRWLASSC